MNLAENYRLHVQLLLMIDIKKILKHNVVGKLLNHLIVFAINIYIVRLLTATGSGAYFNELYILNFVTFIFSAGLDYSAIALIAQKPSLVRVIHKMLFRAALLFSVIILVVFTLLHGENQYFRQPGIAVALFSIGNLLLIFYQGVLSACRKFNTQNLILFVTNAAFLCYLIIFFKYKVQPDLNMIKIGYASLFLVQGIIMYVFSHTKAAPVQSTLSWNTFIRPGIYIMISSLVYFAFLRADNFFVEKYTDKLTLGNYVQCGKIGQYFLYFSSVISSTLLPFISSESIGQSFTEWKKMMQPYILLLCIGALIIALSGKMLFPLLFGNDFKDMYLYMLILLPGFICLGILTLVNAIYIGKGNIKKMLTGDLIGLALVTVFDAWLVPLYGAYAAAIVSSIAYCVVFIFLLTGFKKQFSLETKTSKLSY